MHNSLLRPRPHGKDFKILLTVGHGIRGTGAGSGIVRQSGDINQKLVARSACRTLPAACAGTRCGYVIYRSCHAGSSESESEGRQSIGMQKIIRRKERSAVNNFNIRLDYNDCAYTDS